MSFKKNFIWGAASASAQIEGAYLTDGRTESIWDIAPKGKIKNDDTCHDGCDSYNHYKEDIKIMKEIGIKAYRFSLSWSRIIPEEGKINPLGIKFYNDVIDTLIENGIEPMITIFHWDLPVWVNKYGGWLSKKTISFFEEYTKVVVENFSDRVRYFMPMNEPECFITCSYVYGVHAPFIKDSKLLTKASKVAMEAFAKSVDIIRKEAKQKPIVGIAYASGAYVPDDDSKEELEHARRETVEEGMGVLPNKWWMDPMILGKGVYCNYEGKHFISESFAKKIQRKLDFIGLNLYQPFNNSTWDNRKEKRTDVGFGFSSMNWLLDERVMYYAPKFIYEKYKTPIMITENGLALDDTISNNNKVHDDLRIKFLERYIFALRKAVEDGIPVIGYLHWSIMDNFEWAEGYGPRFGLVYVDYKTKTRTPKESSYVYKQIIETNGENLKLED